MKKANGYFWNKYVFFFLYNIIQVKVYVKRYFSLIKECNRMVSQVQSLQQAIQRTRRESEFNRNILIKKFFNNS